MVYFFKMKRQVFRLCYSNCRFDPEYSGFFASPSARAGQSPVQWKPSGHSCELRSKGKAEADIVVAVVRLPVVAVRGAAVLRGVVPTAAAMDAVRALWRLTFKP